MTGIAATAMLIIATVFVVLEFIVFRGSTPSMTDEMGGELPKSIASLERIPLGGVDQYVLIRGADSTSPILLFLHGGPGMPTMFLAHAFQRDLERDFVVVHWDRRGAGKSYRSGRISDSITVGQTLDDTYELTRRLLGRFRKKRLFLAAHSWGTLLGMLAIKGHPEYYTAYVGMGQLSSDSLRRYAAQRKFLYNMARGYGDADLMRRLMSGGGIREEDLFRYGAALRASRSFFPLLLTGFRAPEYDLFDVLNISRGASMVMERMKNDIPLISFDDDFRRIEIPVYFLLGRHDYTTPSILAAEYYDVLVAPQKGLVWFEQSAHFPFWEEPGKFSGEMSRIRLDVERYWMNEQLGRRDDAANSPTSNTVSN